MHLPVLKTYKVFIDGKFPRGENGLTYPLKDKKGKTIANICLCSRKDLKAAVVAARQAQAGWWERSAFNRSQILYRVAEMMEGRREQFAEEMRRMGLGAAAIKKEINCAIDNFVYYAGWCDKYQAIFSSVNPVASPHYNFSVPEPMGVVCALAPEESPLAGMAAVIAAIISGGNTCVALASYRYPLCAITLSEVLATSDLPSGVVNILSGRQADISGHMAGHLDVNALVCATGSAATLKELEAGCAQNLKRFRVWNMEWAEVPAPGPGLIMDLQEIKTTWHPLEKTGGAGIKY